MKNLDDCRSLDSKTTVSKLRFKMQYNYNIYEISKQKMKIHNKTSTVLKALHFL